MKKSVLILISAFAFACSETDTKEKVKDKIVEQVETTKPTIKQDLKDTLSSITSEMKSESAELTEKVEGVIKGAVEEKREAINKSVDKKVKEVVNAIIPNKNTEQVTGEVLEEANEIVESKEFSHTAFDALLKSNVSATGVVNYAGLKSQRPALEAYIKTLQEQGIESTWSRNEKLAYYINAYNAYTIQLILNNYPLTSIMKINNGKAWDLQVVNLGGKVISLNHLENKIIRPQFNEPRIHFAVNCAAVSCPKLMNGAFLPNQLNSQLQRQTKAFINNTKENQVSPTEVKLSQIFEWYAADFGDIKTFVNKYASTKANADATVSYNTYKWELNGK